MSKNTVHSAVLLVGIILLFAGLSIEIGIGWGLATVGVLFISTIVYARVFAHAPPRPDQTAEQAGYEPQHDATYQGSGQHQHPE